MLKKTRSKLIFVLALFLPIFLISGCNPTNQISGQNPAGPAESIQQTTQQTEYPLVYTDDSGVETTLKSEPQRIVCLAPASTEILSALGLESKLVALTIYDTYPVGIQDKVEYVFEDSLNPNLEQLLQLNPDLVVLGMHEDSLIKSIRGLNIPVVHLNPDSITTTYQAIEKLGIITNTQAQAKNLIQSMKEKEQAIADKVNTIKDSERLKVWLEVDPGFYTAGAGTFLNELLVKAGGTNIANDVQNWAQYSEEQVLAKNPQVIFETYSYYVDNAKETIYARSAWQNIDAVKNKRVYSLDSDMVTRPGPRIIDGLESIAKLLYPEMF